MFQRIKQIVTPCQSSISSGSTSDKAGFKNFVMLLKGLTLTSIIALTTGCSNMREQSVSPWEEFDPDSDEAIVLVSLQLDEHATAINQQGLMPHRGPSRMVFAMYAETESLFTLKSIQLSQPADNPRTLYFSNTKTLKIEEPGIYFYGNVLKMGGKVYLDYMLKQQQIDRASQRYPKVFEQLESKNF
ncbi:hypothetical protein [Oceanospirillum sanctuarii]|uniref:hypothetical protein n=1 Tax=Oceanospirillum sanctuarii TaxID=1434821 RepID=UPI000A3B369C|nr:hypothetical protein [Oceanospirillum sanctuarii]